MSQQPQNVSQQPSPLPSPTGKAAPAPPVLSGPMLQPGQAASIAPLNQAMYSVQGLQTSSVPSNLATGLIAQTTVVPFQYRSTAFHSIGSSAKPIDVKLAENSKVKDFLDRWAHVTVIDLEAEFVPSGRMLWCAASCVMMWLPETVAKPGSSDGLMSYPGAQRFTVGGPAGLGNRQVLQCSFDNGIQPVLKAPLPFAGVPKLVVAVHDHYDADHEEVSEAAHIGDLIIRGKFVAVGPLPVGWI